MTFPRATVQQAVEFLKVHQVRRENAAISRNVQALRDELNSQRNEVDKDRILLKTGLETIADQGMNTNFCDAKIETLHNSIEAVRKEVSSTHDAFKMEVNKGLEQERRLRCRIEEDLLLLRQTLESQAYSNQSELDLTKVSLDTFVEELQQKADQISMEQVIYRIKNLEARPLSTENAVRSISRIPDSIEDMQKISAGTVRWTKDRGIEVDDVPVSISDHESQGQITAQQKQDVREEQTNTILTDISEEMMLSLNSSQQNRDTATPEDIDLDENSMTFSHVGSVNTVEQSVLSLSQPITKTSYTIAYLVSFQQARSEAAEEYMRRGGLLVEQLPEEIEPYFVKKFVQGLSDSETQEYLHRYFAVHAVSWSGVKDAIEYRNLDIQEVVQRRDGNIPIENAVDPNVTPDDASAQQNRVVPKQVLDQRVLPPRRSQRLAAQASLSNSEGLVRVAAPNGPGPTSQQPVKHGLTTHKAKKSPKTRAHSSSTTQSRGNTIECPRTPSPIRQPRDSSGRSSAASDMRTTAPLGERDHPATPQAAEQAIPPMTPYRPIPRLIPCKRKRRPQHFLDRSDEAFLPKRRITLLQISDKTAGRGQRAHKEHNMAVEMPPMTRILSTSTDGNEGQFDRWN